MDIILSSLGFVYLLATRGGISKDGLALQVPGYVGTLSFLALQVPGYVGTLSCLALQVPGYIGTLSCPPAGILCTTLPSALTKSFDGGEPNLTSTPRPLTLTFHLTTTHLTTTTLPLKTIGQFSVFS